MEKFHNKYRISSARKPFWNYADDGLYYITICTFNRELIFGQIEDYSLVPSAEGKIVVEEWNKSFEIRKELFCEAFVMMPNHLHAILRIENVETHGRASLQKKYGIAYRPPKSISSFVAGFKSSSTKRINECRDSRPCVSTKTRTCTRRTAVRLYKKSDQCENIRPRPGSHIALPCRFPITQNPSGIRYPEGFVNLPP